MATGFHTLPVELVQLIILHLFDCDHVDLDESMRTLSAVSQTCKRLRSVCNNEYVWRTIYTKLITTNNINQK